MPVLGPASHRVVDIMRSVGVLAQGTRTTWPRTHYIGASPLVRATIEPGVGGRWYSTHEDGSEAPWGEVLVGSGRVV